ncbi:MAG: hypothetical protein ACRCZM_08675, partial [Bacteroidales bacterium]
MPIQTPQQSLLIQELPVASKEDTAIQAIVNTALGPKRLPLGELFEPYNLLVGSVHFYTGEHPVGFGVPLLGGV